MAQHGTLVATEPYHEAVAVAPHDATNLDKPCDALFVGTGGALTAVIAGTAVTFANVPSGTLLPIRATRVNDTGTDADDIVALNY